jgi:hypothetical protein
VSWSRRVRSAVEAYDRERGLAPVPCDALAAEITAGIVLIVLVGVTTAQIVYLALR